MQWTANFQSRVNAFHLTPHDFSKINQITAITINYAFHAGFYKTSWPNEHARYTDMVTPITTWHEPTLLSNNSINADYHLPHSTTYCALAEVKLLVNEPSCQRALADVSLAQHYGFHSEQFAAATSVGWRWNAVGIVSFPRPQPFPSLRHGSVWLIVPDYVVRRVATDYWVCHFDCRPRNAPN